MLIEYTLSRICFDYVSVCSYLASKHVYAHEVNNRSEVFEKAHFFFDLRQLAQCSGLDSAERQAAASYLIERLQKYITLNNELQVTVFETKNKLYIY